MSRRTERPYQVDGTGRLAQHSEAPCSVPEINGPVVQREFTFLLRETCKRAPSETAGARVSNGPRALAGVSRGRSTEGNEPGNTGGPHNSGRAELGRQNTTIGGLVPGAMKPIGRALGSDHRGRERVAAVSVRDCQEPPDADPHVRWRGRREGQPSRRPDWVSWLRWRLGKLIMCVNKVQGIPGPRGAGQQSRWWGHPLLRQFDDQLRRLRVRDSNNRRCRDRQPCGDWCRLGEGW